MIEATTDDRIAIRDGDDTVVRTGRYWLVSRVIADAVEAIVDDAPDDPRRDVEEVWTDLIREHAGDVAEAVMRARMRTASR